MIFFNIASSNEELYASTDVNREISESVNNNDSKPFILYNFFGSVSFTVQGMYTSSISTMYLDPTLGIIVVP